MKIFKDILAPMWLGFSIAFFGHITFMQWQFYAIIIPFYILARATGFNQKDEE